MKSTLLSKRYLHCLGLLSALSLVALTTGCASTAPSIQLEEASNLLKQEEARDLRGLRPKLLRQAREYEIKARQAYERGDYEKSKLYARMAIQKYNTAKNFVQRAQDQQLAQTMQEASKTLDGQEAQIAIREQEKTRYDKLKTSFNTIQSEQAAAKNDAQSKSAQARRALLKARTLQAEVIGANAIQYETSKYAQARLLIESSLGAYESQTYDVAIKNADSASSLLAGLLELAEKKKNEPLVVAKAPQDANNPTPTAAVDPQQQQSDSLARLARQAIDSALKAQSLAIAAGMDKSASTEYAQAKFLIESAQQRLGTKDYEGAQKSAIEAQSLFSAGSKVTPPSNDDKKKVLTLIQEAEDARADAIRRGADKSSDVTQGDYALDLARKANQQDQSARALEKATQAKLLYQQAKNAEKPAVTTTTTAPVAQKPANTSKVEAMILELQLKRADAVGALMDTTCGGPFKAFEVLLAQAQKRLDAGDAWQAFEFAVRASERFKQCQPTAGKPTAALSKREQEAQTKAAELLKKQREDAATAMQKAQSTYAKLSATLPGDKRLRQPASLLANADKWFQKRMFEQALASAQDAQKGMEDIEKEALKAVKQAKIDPKTNAKTDPKAQAKKAIGDCSVAKRQLDQAQAAKLRVANLTMDDMQSTQFKQNVRLLTRAQDMLTAQQCDDATLLAAQSQSNFEFLIALSKAPKPQPVDPTRVVTKTAPISQTPIEKPMSADVIRAKMKAEQDKKKQEALAREAMAKAKLWRSRVTNQSGSVVFQTADGILSQATQQMENNQWTNAAVLAEQSAGAYASLEKAAAAKMQADEAKWKPAYAKVIQALETRDLVQSKVGAPEKATFELGIKSLKRARTAWESKQFFVAGKFADSARDHFDRVNRDANLRLKQEKAQADALADRNAKDAKAREALAQKRKEEEAKRKAEEAKARAAAEEKARKALEAKTQAESLERQQIQAEDAMRRVAVSYELCQKGACGSRDSTAWIKAKKEYEDAQLAFKEKRYKRAQALAASAKMSFDTTLEKPMPFKVDSKITRVTRVGDSLVLTPKISFKTGGVVATVDSLKTVQALAQVIIANAQTIETVTLVGYTDSRGKRDDNIKLSTSRAEAVKRLLVKRGVKASMLRVEGKGPDAPVADNKTSKGREANRRVEVSMSWKATQ